MNRFAWIIPAILWVDIGYLLAVSTMPLPAQRAAPCECESLRDTVTRNTQRIVENEHDIRELEGWREFMSRTSQEHGVNDAVKFAELETTVHAHERILWLIAAAVVAVIVEIAYRRLKRREAP